MQKINYISLNLLWLMLLSGSFLFQSCTGRKEKSVQKNNQSNQKILPARQLNQWQEDKLSLFVHFGVYSSLAGTWNNTQIDGPSEEIWANGGMYVEDYERAARNFDPNKWNARDVVGLARKTGLRTVIITAKHLDGFCLFKTESTTFNMDDFTTGKKDIIAEMAEACHAASIRLSLSFSLTDWHLPEAHPMSGYNASPVSDKHHATNLIQIKELLTNYGEIAEIYFHSGINSPKQSREIHQLVKELQPNCLISNGIGNSLGDFYVSEFNTPPKLDLDVPWITPASIHPSTRGYKNIKEHGEVLTTARQKIRELVDVIASGGNYALSLGPKGDGSISDFEEETLKQIGRWIKVNRNGIFGAQKNPFPSKSKFWQITQNNNHLYIFVDSVPETQKIKLPGLTNKISSARFLGSGIELNFSQKGQTLEIDWTSPVMADPMQLPVIEIELKDPPQITCHPPIQIKTTDTIALNQGNAVKYHRISGGEKFSSAPSITRLKWLLKADRELNGELRFTTHEQNKTIVLKTSDENTNMTLTGKPGKLISSPTDTLETGKIFRSSAFFGALDKIHINPNSNNRLQVAKTSWMGISKENKKTLLPLPMTSHYYYIEIDSENDQQHSYEITGNDGLQIWLNKAELLLSRNNNPEKPLIKTLVLNLKKGKNILLIKNYNRTGTKDHFGLTPKPQARWILQPLPLTGNSGIIEISHPDGANPHEDLDLINFSIILTPKQ